MGAKVFLPDGEPSLTGIALDVRVWNTGKPSRIVQWSLAVVPQGAMPIFAQHTKMPNTLTAGGEKNSLALRASDSLDDRTLTTDVGLEPLSDRILFYVPLEKEIAGAGRTLWDMTAEDLFQQTVRSAQKVGDWISR